MQALMFIKLLGIQIRTTYSLLLDAGSLKCVENTGCINYFIYATVVNTYSRYNSLQWIKMRFQGFLEFKIVIGSI